MATGFVMDVGALAFAVEDHDDLGRPVDGGEGVRCHGGKLGCLARLDGYLAFAERQAHPTLDDEEPVVTGVGTLLLRPSGRYKPRLDGDRAAGWSAEHPGCAVARRVRHRVNEPHGSAAGLAAALQLVRQRRP